MNDFLEQFLIESRELSEQATAGLLALERAPGDAAQLDGVFRAVHTLKGGAGIVDFHAMERAVHAAEDLLGAARAGQRLLSPALIGDCLSCVDQVLQWLDILETTGELPSQDSEAEADRIVARFAAAMDAGQSPARSDITDRQSIGELPSRDVGPLAGDSDLPAPARELLEAQLALVRVSTSADSYGHLASAAVTAANVLRACGRDADAQSVAELTGNSAADLAPALQSRLQQLLGTVEPQASAPADAPSPAAARTEATPRTLRVDAGRIDALVRLTGELTVAKNALAHLVKLAQAEANPQAAALKARHAAFDHLVGELQRAVLALRVLPLRVVFQRFPRLMREMSETLGKPVELKMLGEDTEADKAIVEMLFEPLLHVVRNAIDHGVESAAVRIAQGKPRVATIEMRAARQGDQVMVEIADDGAGLHLQRIRAVAAQREVATTEVLQAMSDAELADLVFAPGFSTATEISAVSGRGVGMDAVRIAVERVGGRVTIHSEPGHGATVRFMLPFSVMMTTVMSVEAGGQMFGVPLDTVVETIRVPRSTLAAIGTARAVVVRDETIPVFDLAQMLGEPAPAHEGGDATIVITAFAGQRCGLDVAALGERLDVILKPLDGLLGGTPGITGTTLLGDGRVLLVLDIAGLLQ